MVLQGPAGAHPHPQRPGVRARTQTGPREEAGWSGLQGLLRRVRTSHLGWRPGTADRPLRVRNSSAKSPRKGPSCIDPRRPWLVKNLLPESKPVPFLYRCDCVLGKSRHRTGGEWGSGRARSDSLFWFRVPEGRVGFNPLPWPGQWRGCGLKDVLWKKRKIKRVSLCFPSQTIPFVWVWAVCHPVPLCRRPFCMFAASHPERQGPRGTKGGQGCPDGASPPFPAAPSSPVQ